MVDPLELIHRLNEWRREWHSAREGLVRSTLRLSLDSCNALVEIQDIRSDSAVLLHERVKSLYGGVSSVLGSRLQPDDLEIVIFALSSARIYYWIRYLKGHFSDELDSLIRRRAKWYGRLPSSLSAAYLAIQAITPEAAPKDLPGLPEESLELLRRGCLADFAKLELVVNRYGGGEVGRS